MRIAVKKLPRCVLVFFVMFVGCSNQGPNITATFNQGAFLLGTLPVNPLQWNVITSMLNPKDSTMATLYGNDTAVQYARTHAQHDYPSGSTLALVTWSEGDDTRWFGARIPSPVKCVEFVFVRAIPGGGTSYTYQKYEGSPLKMGSLQEGFVPNERASYLLAKRAAVMP
jgi:hypothetical protein